MRTTFVGLTAILLFGSLAAFAAPASAASVHFFNDCKHPDHSQFFVMTNGAPDDDDCLPDHDQNRNGATTSDAVKVPGNSCSEWISLETSESEATYSKDGWSGAAESVGVVLPSPTYPVSIGYFNKDEGQVYHVAATLTFDLDTSPLPPGQIADNHDPADGSFVVPADSHLLVRICGNQGNSPRDVFLGQGSTGEGGGSFLATPDGGPPFPVPELHTSVLLAVGLGSLALVGAAAAGFRWKP